MANVDLENSKAKKVKITVSPYDYHYNFDMDGACVVKVADHAGRYYLSDDIQAPELALFYVLIMSTGGKSSPVGLVTDGASVWMARAVGYTQKGFLSATGFVWMIVAPEYAISRKQFNELMKTAEELLDGH